MAKRPTAFDNAVDGLDKALSDASKTRKPAVRPSSKKSPPVSYVGDIMSGDHSATRVGRQRKLHTLPASRTEVVFELMELDPKDTFASPLNPRCQELMTEHDAKVLEIKDSMLHHTQQEPAYARTVRRDGEVRYEVYVGTTRRFCAELLNKELAEGFKLKAWVADVGDGDAALMAREENDKRRDLSAYEKALDLISRARTIGLGRIPDPEVAAKLGVEKGYFSRYQRIATLDIELVALLDTPGLLTLRPALQAVSLLNDMSKEERTAVYDQVRERCRGGRYDSPQALIKNLKAVIHANEPTAGQNEEDDTHTIADSSGKVLARIIPPKKAGGTAKVELYGPSSEQLNQLSKALAKLLSS